MKIILAAIIVASAFGQGKQNVIVTGVTDASGLTFLAPSSTYASRPGSPVTKQVWIMTDKQCDGSGSGPSNCRWNGSSWDAIGGGGSGSSPLTTKGDLYTYSTTNARLPIGANGLFLSPDSTAATGLKWATGPAGFSCVTGTVTAATLAGLGTGASKEVSIFSSVPGTTRYDQVLVSETVLFTGTTGLTVSMGRPGSTTHDELTGASLPLQVSAGDTNYFSARPIPPQLTTTYNLVLNFAVASGNVNSATAGTLYYEVCSYVR